MLASASRTKAGVPGWSHDKMNERLVNRQAVAASMSGMQMFVESSATGWSMRTGGDAGSVLGGAMCVGSDESTVTLGAGRTSTLVVGAGAVWGTACVFGGSGVAVL